MKILCVDPVTSRGSVCSFTFFNEAHEFQYQQIISSTEVNKFLKEDITYVCFDAFKTFGVFEFKFPFLYDVKILEDGSSSA
jgi:hypothetical protein